MTATSQEVKRAKQRSQVGQARLFGLVSRVRELGLLIVLLLIVLIVGIQAPRFLSLDNFVQILLSVAILAIVAVGETLVVLTRNVDLSVGSIVGLTAFVTAYFFKELPQSNLLLGILLGCALGLGLGMVNGLIVSLGRVPAIVATLGTLYAYRGLVFIVSSNTTSQINASDVPSSYLALATTQIFGIPTLILIAAVIAVIVGYFLHSSQTGRQLYAVGSNPDAANIIGIRREWLVFAAFAASGLLCGLAGVLWGARFGTVDSTNATGLELAVIAAVVVGGVNIFGGSGTILGVMLGAIVLGTLQNALNILNVSQFWLQALYGAAILGAVVLDAFITRWVQRTILSRRKNA
ncbi:MAG TPA: ATPase [Ktedonobacter sp.]|jgi:rhamnose transport system permease protein|nr:ATPase [Ktedonobacter sp.]HAG97817.1 ATPase [Ktedonobacter sp.]HAT45388.1 ATPase [Ktedonobacter sp.]HBE24200.1 ATPase [Ktedonobacter sp.]HBE27455.1 ATPase [Ktedonobacter sp.]